MSVAKKTRTGTTCAFPRTLLLCALRSQRAHCATSSTSGKPASSRSDPSYPSVCDFFWQFVPADTVAHVGPELPLDRLGRALGDAKQFPRLRQRVVGRALRDQAWPLGDQRG